MRTMVIAEPGSCHEGNFATMCRLVEAAKDAGADVFKAQYWSDPQQFAERRHAPELIDTYRRYAVPAHWLPALRTKCDTRGLQFACSVYLPGDVWEVSKHADILKVAAFEAQDRELLTMLRAPVAAGKMVIISLGMGASSRLAQDVLDGVSLSEGRVRFLHCVSAYPADVGQLNLRRIRSSSFGGERITGFSDHADSGHTWTGALAVAAGARIVERHLRLDDTPATNPDYPHAMPPTAFADYVRHIRFAESVLGDPLTAPQPCEEPMLKYRVGV